MIKKQTRLVRIVAKVKQEKTAKTKTKKNEHQQRLKTQKM
jgi:hypothetical protein